MLRIDFDSADVKNRLRGIEKKVIRSTVMRSLNQAGKATKQFAAKAVSKAGVAKIRPIFVSKRIRTKVYVPKTGIHRAEVTLRFSARQIDIMYFSPRQIKVRGGMGLRYGVSIGTSGSRIKTG